MRKQTLYERAGITDLAEFYRTKFVSDEVLDARYFKALDRFDVRFARTMWIYDNVRAGSSVLELGCGAGMLALLKRKGVTLTGVDLSSECAIAARRNGYDTTLSAELSNLPFADDSFDVIVSNFAIHNISGRTGREKAVSEAVRVLRPGGRLLIVDVRGTRHHRDQLARMGMTEVARRRLGWRLMAPLVTATKPQRRS